MKRYNFNCSFEVRSSHGISTAGFSGSSTFVIENGVSCACPFGLKNTSVEIEKCNDSQYKLSIESYELIDQVSQIKYLDDLSSFLSFLIGKGEINGSYGTPYIHLKLESFLCTEKTVQDHKLNGNDIVINDFLHISDSLSIQSTRHFKFENSSLSGAFNHDVVSVYRNGLKAESEKSKFFHWFLILEFLEGTPLYSQMFPKGSMFNDEETRKIRELANTLQNDKKGILLSVLTRTSEFRGKKLSDLLANIGVTSISSMQGNHEVSIDTIKEIIDARNKIFHRGNELPTGILWFKLFPIVTAVVEKLVYERDCIEENS
jgi:hypothetical protein